MGSTSSKVVESSEEEGIVENGDARVPKTVQGEQIAAGLSSKVVESSEEKGIMENGDARSVFSGTKANGLKRVSDDHFRKETEKSEVLRNDRPNIRRAARPSIRRVPNAVQGEQIAAGWPSWLTAVAGEAINGWVPRRADTFEKIDKIGQGTYSNVYKARDITNGKIVALKKVTFDNLEPESVKFMAREILILRRLHHPNIIKLEGLVTSRLSCTLYLVFEYMEHDLTGITSLPGVKFTEPQVKCYMHQLLTGLEYCHSRGVLHRDIKCSNLLLDNHGKLKIADFGLSSFFDGYQNFALTSRVVTLWYRPPELLLGEIHYGVAVDLWSSGCVLGELYAGKPIMPGKTEVEQLHKIFKLCGSPSDDYWRKSKLPHATVFKPQHPYTPCLAETFKDISPTAFSLLVTLLSLDPEHRGTAASALQSEFFATEPLACDPLSLPKYPPSKEAYARLQERKANSPRVMGAPIRYEFVQREPKEARARPSHDVTQVLDAAVQARRKKDRPGKMLKEPNHQKTDAAQQRLEKARADKAQAPMNETIINPVYPWPSHVPSSYKAQLLKLDDHCQKGAEETRPGKKWDKLLDRVTAAHVYTGPEIVPSYNVDQLLEEHDRQIQESAQKLRHEKRRESKIQVRERQKKDHSIPSVPLPVSVSNVDDLLDEHDRQIQESTQRWRLEKKKTYKVNP